MSSACSKKSTELKDESWQTIILNRYGPYAKQPSLIFVVPEKKKEAGIGLLMLPTGSDKFNRFAPIAFMADEDGQNVPPAGNPPNPNNNTPNNSPEGDTTATEEEEGAVFVGPSMEELFWEPTGPRPEVGPDEELTPEQEEAINQKLDEALDSAFNTRPDPDSIRLRIRVMPPFGLPNWWEKMDTDITPTPQPDTLDLLRPSWKDMPYPDGGKPDWWPLNKPFPPDRFRLPDEFKPLDGGFKLGDWRIYIVPIPGEGQ